MTKEHRHKLHGAAAAEGARRDPERAATEMSRGASQADGESAAELRLRSLIHEMEKDDDLEEDEAPDQLSEDDITGSHWHWSDDPPDID